MSSQQRKRQQRKKSPLRLVFKELVVPFFWRSEERWKALGLLALTLALIFGLVYSLVLLNLWNQAFYDALQRLDRPEFVHQLWRFFFIAFAAAMATAFKFFTLQGLALRWRTWMTEKNLQRWFSHKNFYHWQLDPRENDNPDQRLSEDIFELSDLSLEIAEKIFREAITFVSFIGILWGLSSSLHFTLFGWSVELHRYLVVICLIYAFLGTWLVHRVGNPLASLHFFQQRFEADFRFLLVRLRENAEGIALAGGEPAEKEKLFSRFGFIARNFKQVISRQRNVLLTSNIYGQVAYIFPFVVASSKVFTREITLGQLFQISSAFGQVQGSVSVFIDLYAKIARWYSVVVRLGGFLDSLESNESLRRTAIDEHVKLSPSSALRARDLTLRTPQGVVLARGLNLDLAKGERLLFTAESGAGKSTLVRTLNGLWPHFSGHIEIPMTERRLVLQQNPYFPVGTLKAALAYPHAAEAYTNEDYLEALHLSGLANLQQVLEQEEHWSQRLSSGERQRLSLARAFLQKPDLLFLDEATSALGQNAEQEILTRLLTHLPKVTVLTLTHQATHLMSLHQKTQSL